MLSPLSVCSHCSDEWEPIEGISVRQDPDDLQFCSVDCEQAFYREEEALTEYHSGRYGGAPVWP